MRQAATREGCDIPLTALALSSAQVAPARAQMGSSLAFHIILACTGIALPAIAIVAVREIQRLRAHSQHRFGRRTPG